MGDMETKSFGSLEIKDEERGEVEAIVATLEVVDRDGDVILPGAIPRGGAKVKLSGYGHDVILQDAPPVGIGTIREEGGKALFDGRFFMSTSRGREAFAVVKELGTDGEWSFGFPNASVTTSKMTDEWKEKGARRLIASMAPVEASPVFRGAGLGTMTMHTKVLKASDASLTDRVAAVNDALRERNRGLGDDAEFEEFWFGVEVFDDNVIVQAGRSLFRVAYEINDGEVTLGEATEVEVVYQVVEEKADEVEPDIKAEPAADSENDDGEDDDTDDVRAEQDDGGDIESVAEAEASKAKAASAIEEYERVQRTLKRLGVA